MPYDVQDMLVRTREITFKYFGADITFSYYVEKVTKEFRADIIRLAKLSYRLNQQRVELVNGLAPSSDDDITEEDDDAQTEKLLAELDKEDEKLKRKIDVAVAGILADWDMTNNKQPYPPTVENLYIVDARIERAIVDQIMEDATPLGEASGRRNMRLLQRTSKQKVKRAI